MASTSRLVGRTRARSQALQILFQAEACGRSVDDVLAGDYALSDGPLDEFAERLARGAGSCIPELDRLLSGAAQNWGLSRMPAVDRNLLRLSLYEMLHVDEVAIPVTISESVELAKIYGTDESSRFVNGVLGRLADDLAPERAKAHVDGSDRDPDDVADGAAPADDVPEAE